MKTAAIVLASLGLCYVLAWPAPTNPLGWQVQEPLHRTVVPVTDNLPTDSAPVSSPHTPRPATAKQEAPVEMPQPLSMPAASATAPVFTARPEEAPSSTPTAEVAVPAPEVPRRSPAASERVPEPEDNPAPPEERTAPESPSAREEGGFLSANAERYFGRYAQHVRSRVSEEYTRLVGERYRGDASSATLSFLVQADGSVTDVQSVNPSGDESFVYLCEDVARAISPLDPIPYAAAPNLPSHLVGEPLAFRFDLEFDPGPQDDRWSDAEEFSATP